MSTRVLLAALLAPIALAACGEVVVEAPRAPVVAVAPVPVRVAMPNGTLIKGPVENGFNRYWIVINGQKHLSELKTVTALGLDVPNARPEPEAALLPDGHPMHTNFSINQLVPQSLSKLQNRTVVRAANSPALYIVVLGQRHLLEEDIVMGFGFNPGMIVTVTPSEMQQIPEGPAW